MTRDHARTRWIVHVAFAVTETLGCLPEGFGGPGGGSYSIAHACVGCGIPFERVERECR